MSTITLAFLAHNEARFLPRIKEQLGDRINSVVIISDPPNDDGTMEVAKELFGQYNSKFIERPWPTVKDSAACARNQLMLQARSMGDDYVLWIDPDSPLVGTIPWELDQPFYAFTTLDKQSNISWMAVHLVRSDQTARWTGRIHEYIDTGPAPISILNTAYIERDGSGGGRDRWLNWDLPTLLELVAEEPHNPRHVNYLGQTYRDLAMYPEAIAAYTKRTLLYGMEEETFYAHYMLGIISILQKEYGNAEYYLLKAHAFRPSRKEPLERLIEIYQTKQEFVLAIQLMKNLSTLPPTKDVTMVQNRPFEIGQSL